MTRLAAARPAAPTAGILTETRTRIPALVLVATLAALPTAPAFGAVLPAPATDPDRGIEIRLTSFFDEPPLAGEMPLQVWIRNRSGQDHSWDLHFSSGLYLSERESHVTLAVAAGSEGTFEILASLANGVRGNLLWTQLSVRVVGYGIDGDPVSLFTRTIAPASSTPTPPVAGPPFALSESLASAYEEEVKKELEGRGRLVAGSRFLSLPSDWRGLSSFATLWMTEGEWRGLGPGPRKAVKDWVALGGGLHLILDQPASDDPRGPPQRLGFGQITLVLSRDTMSSKVAEVILAGGSLYGQLQAYHDWSLLESVGPITLPAIALSLVVVGFGLAVGPLNLFVFARGTRRSRVFWITPLLSTVTGAAIAAFILFHDGLGGEGARWTAVFLLPEENQAVVLQEQVARTGVLFGGTFGTEEPILLEPIQTDDNGSERFGRGAHRHPHSGLGLGEGRFGRLARRGDVYGGDWFASRSIRPYFAATVRPGRGRLLLAPMPGGGRTAVSTLDATLDDLFAIDDEGLCWHGRDLRAGERTPLTRCADAEYVDWWAVAKESAGDRIASLLEEHPPGKGQFAASSHSSGLAIATHPKIRWQQKGVLVLGPWQKAS